MITSWREKYPGVKTEDFVKYFSKQWLSPKRSGWYDHYCDHCPDSDSEKPAKKTATKRKKVATPESDSDYDIFEETNKVVVASTSAAKSSITVTKAAAKQVTKPVIKTVTKAALEQTARVTRSKKTKLND